MRLTITLDPGDEPGVWRDCLPLRGHHVYVLSAHDGQTLYVGQTEHLRDRIKHHARNQPWWWMVGAIDVLSVPDELRAREGEVHMTGQLHPLHSEVTALDRARLDRLRAAS